MKFFKKYRLFLRKNWFLILTLCILIIAAILRFYDYPNRWGFAYDQAHDVIVARHAVENLRIPLVGPFASGAPVQTSGIWYWYIMLGIGVYPFSMISPWVLLTILHVAFVLLLTLLAKKLLNEKLAVIVGFLAAVSTAQMTQSTNLTLTAPMAFISLFAIWAMVNYMRKKSYMNIFLFGLAIGFGPSTHLSGVSLGIFFFITFLFLGIPWGKPLIFLFIGLLLPFIPNLLFDLQNDFVHFNGLLHYVQYDQTKISYESLGRSWKSYLFSLVPNVWGYIIGGGFIGGAGIMILLSITMAYNMYKKTVKKEWIILFFTLIGILVMLRYTKVQLFDSYFVFLHPFIVLLSGWTVYKIISYSKFIGLAVFLLIVFFSIKLDIEQIKNATNITAERVNHWADVLVKKYPDEKFLVYDWSYQTAAHSIPAVAKLQELGKLDDKGHRVGFHVATPGLNGNNKAIESLGGVELIDLQGSTSARLKKLLWGEINPSFIYKSTEGWYSRK